MDRTTLNWLLSFNYVPNMDADLPSAIRRATSTETVNPGGDLVERGKTVLDETFDAAVEEWDNGESHIVPLSSGLDSRCILAGLLDRIDARRIHTVTFGYPGTWDYEYGQRVAETAGVSNTAIDLTNASFDWSYEALRDSAASTSSPIRLPDFHVNDSLNNFLDFDSWTLWNGYLGDPSAGAHLPPSPAETWDDALTEFVDWNTLTDLSELDFEPTTLLPEEPYLPRSELTYREQLDFAIRQPSFIRPLTQSYDWVSPFTRDRWLSFVLNVPREERLGRKLFKRIVTRKWPELFSVPSDVSHGVSPTSHWAVTEAAHYYHAVAYRVRKFLLEDSSHPNHNYLDYSAAFRDETLLKSQSKRAVDAVARSRASEWLEPKKVWTDHQRGEDRTRAVKSMLTVGLYLDVASSRDDGRVTAQM